MPAKTALILLHEGVEEMEFVAPVDILRRGGVEVTVAAAGNHPAVTGRSGLRIKADLLLVDALYSPQTVWDLLVIPGGPGVSALRKDPLAQEAVRRHAGKLIGAICAAPLVLLDAGLLAADGSTAPYTAHPGTLGELPAADAGQPVVIASIAAKSSRQTASVADSIADNTSNPTTLVTSRGAGTATVFALALLEQVIGGAEGKKTADSVAASICFNAVQ